MPRKHGFLRPDDQRYAGAPPLVVCPPNDALSAALPVAEKNAGRQPLRHLAASSADRLANVRYDPSLG